MTAFVTYHVLELDREALVAERLRLFGALGVVLRQAAGLRHVPGRGAATRCVARYQFLEVPDPRSLPLDRVGEPPMQTPRFGGVLLAA